MKWLCQSINPERMASFTDLTVHRILSVGGEEYMHEAFWGCKLQRKEISAYRWLSIIESVT